MGDWQHGFAFAAYDEWLAQKFRHNIAKAIHFQNGGAIDILAAARALQMLILCF